MFATGIECSYPTIDHGQWRMDELEAIGHYRNWQRDLALVGEIGLRYLRYGPPYYRIHLGPGRYDWSFTDEVLPAMRNAGLVPIMDLCHFGVPAWLGNFQNPALPCYFAEYAGAFARRYPWVRLYTPVNEMYVTAKMSALDGARNEQLRSDAAFARAAIHVARANVLAIPQIRAARPDAVFITSESSEYFPPCCPDPQIVAIASFENQRRFVPLDLLYAHPVRPDVFRMLQSGGMTREEYEWFMNQDAGKECILGVDYYRWNERLVDAQGRPESLGELFGWFVITKQYYDRYQRPLMHTETNIQDSAHAPAWLWRQWHNVELMQCGGVPVVGFTWYSLHDQVDWDTGLTRLRGVVNPVGLFDLNREARPVAEAYRDLVRMFRDHVSIAPHHWLSPCGDEHAAHRESAGDGG
ncbi:MAG: family 1 glycosylhydrolase [Armatimonadetes bacterium]|nr:family 1 glycosylhydrolase [Armatimonadota bacterium]